MPGGPAGRPGAPVEVTLVRHRGLGLLPAAGSGTGNAPVFPGREAHTKIDFAVPGVQCARPSQRMMPMPTPKRTPPSRPSSSGHRCTASASSTG